MAELSENDIKKVALAILKQHYRFRPRTGPTTLQQDLRAEGDLIIDGYISFPREEGAPPFVATVEATSYRTRDEVRYRIQRPLLAWDATAVSAMITTAVLTVLHLQGYYPLFRLGLANTLMGVAGMILFGHLVYMVLFSQLGRYRYIYAVEQFKQYFADEQWIAAGEDVFVDKEDKYFRELRDQCIFQGFGLIIVDRELQGHVHITPSRNDLFDGARRRVRFQTLEEFTRRLPVALPGGKDQKRIGPAAAVPARRRNWMRDPFRYFHQFVVTVFALTLIVTLFYLQWLERPVLVVDEEAYDRRLEELKESNRLDSEPEAYLIDTAALEPFRRRVEPYLQIEPEREAPAASPAPDRSVGQAGLIAVDGSGRIRELPCANVRSADQTRYVIQVDGLSGEGSLESRLLKLNREGLPVAGLWLGCFGRGDAYVMVMRPFYNREDRARRAWERLARAWNERGYSIRLRLRSIQPLATQ